MKILTRYMLRAHLGPFLFSFVALTGVILINTLARRLADLAGKGLPVQVVLEFFFLAIPATIALTFPMAVLVSVLYTFSQFTAENEITALKASGVDLKRMLLPLLLSAAAITAIMVWFNDRVLPEANHRWSQLWVDIARKTPTLVLQSQSINRIPTSDGRTYFLRAARVDPATNRLWDVVIYDVSNPSISRTIYADSARSAFNATRTDLVLRLFNGHIRDVTVAKPEEFTRLAFEEQVFGVPGVGNTLNVSEERSGYRGDREMTIGMLRARMDTLQKENSGALARARNVALLDIERTIAGPSPGDTLPFQIVDAGLAARRTADELQGTHRQMQDREREMRDFEVEIHKKYSIAVASLVFVIIGAPLALRFPSGGIGMVIATSLIIFALYYVGLIGGETLAGAGYVSPVLAMWVMNVLMTVVGLWGLSRMGRETATARGGGLNLLAALRTLVEDPLARLRGKAAP